jgi:hypothetical protein
MGYIYILINPALKELIKIGMTTRTPEERAKELSAQTGIPTSFHVAYESEVSDCKRLEKIIHQRLENFRYSRNREFFSIKLKDAIHFIEREVKNFETVTYIVNSLEIFQDSDIYQYSESFESTFNKQAELLDFILKKLDIFQDYKLEKTRVIIKLLKAYYFYHYCLQESRHQSQLDLFSLLYKLSYMQAEIMIESIFKVVTNIQEHNTKENKFSYEVYFFGLIESLLREGTKNQKLEIAEWAINEKEYYNKWTNHQYERLLMWVIEHSPNERITLKSAFKLFNLFPEQNPYSFLEQQNEMAFWSPSYDYTQLLIDCLFNIFESRQPQNSKFIEEFIADFLGFVNQKIDLNKEIIRNKSQEDLNIKLTEIEDLEFTLEEDNHKNQNDLQNEDDIEARLEILYEEYREMEEEIESLTIEEFILPRNEIRLFEFLIRLMLEMKDDLQKDLLRRLITNIFRCNLNQFSDAFLENLVRLLIFLKYDYSDEILFSYINKIIHKNF